MKTDLLLFTAERMVCKLPDKKMYVVELRRDPQSTGYAISLCMFVEDEGQTVCNIKAFFCVDFIKQIWLPETDENFTTPVKWSSFDEAIEACKYHHLLQSIPGLLSWKDVYHCKRSSFDVTMVQADDYALKSGYPYFLWNDRVYLTNTRTFINRTIDDIS